MALNLLIIGFVILFIIANQSNREVISGSNSTSSSIVSSPLDQLASANIALSVAQATNLPEATSISNQADTQNAQLAMAATDNNIIAKPQVTTTTLKSKANISSYTVQNGDTVVSLATKFGVTSNSIMWSNHLSGNQLTVGQKILIPPVNGIIYTVKAGDTIASLAQRYNANQAQLIAYNDAEISGIYPGERIIIPNGTVSPPVTPAVYSWSGPNYGYNGYDYGYCTWYVASRISVPANWGNASTWAYYASLSGWNVSGVPSVGAIAQTPFAAGGEGHVAIVRAVSSNGDMIKFSDMNGLAGWGRVGYSGWVSAAIFPNYITK